MFSQVGVPELLIVLFIMLLLFGAKRLPALGRQLGGGLREFKDAIGRDRSGEEETAASGERPELADGAPPQSGASGDPAASEVAADRRP